MQGSLHIAVLYKVGDIVVILVTLLRVTSGTTEFLDMGGGEQAWGYIDIIRGDIVITLSDPQHKMHKAHFAIE